MMGRRRLLVGADPLRWWLIAGVALLLNACVSGAPPRPAQTSLPATYGSAGSTPPAESLDHWWTLYDDPQLTALTRRALAQGFSVRQALARLEEARALRSVALSAFDPQGNLQGNAEYRDTRTIGNTGSASIPGLPAGTNLGSRLSGTGVSKTAGINFPVSWEVDLFGRRAATRRGAEADIDKARFDVEAARAEIAAEVARSLFQARGFMVQRDQARASAEIQRKLMAVIAEQARRGLAATSDADRVAGDLAQAEAQADNLDAALTASRRALLAVIGAGTEPLGELEIAPKLGDAPVVPLSLPGDLLQRRPDVRQAEAGIRKAASSERLAELDFFPTINLNPGVGLSAQRGSFDSTTSFWSIGLGLMVPILDRPRLQAQLKAEGARGEQAVLRYEQAVQTAFSETDQALVRLAADRRRVSTLRGGEKRARKAYDAMLVRYQRGFANLQDLLGAEGSWRSTRSALTGAQVDALQRSVQVFQALGGGWDAIPTTAQTTKAANDE